jgi:hypothetical protein
MDSQAVLAFFPDPLAMPILRMGYKTQFRDQALHHVELRTAA